MRSLAYSMERKYELLNGKMVSMSPCASVNHNKVIGNIFRVFSTFLKGKTCEAFVDGVDVHLTENDIFIPDVMIVCNRDIIHKDALYGAPDLIVEVLSPGTEKNDKGYKKETYQQCGVKEYWIVNTDSRSIVVYWLENGQFTLNNVYIIYPDYLLKKMSEEEIHEIPCVFSISFLPELVISVEEVFEGMI